MRPLSFFLVLSIVLCYTGLGADVCHSRTLPNITNCHTNQQDEIPGTETIANSYENTDTTKHKMFMCHDTLTNAPHGHGFNLKDIILYSVAVNIPTLEISKVSSCFPLSLATKREYQPPELFLANSSFLL